MTINTNIKLLALGFALSLLLTAPVAFAEDSSEAKHILVQNVQEYVGGYLYRPLIIQKVVTFDMSQKWWTEWNNNRDKGVGTTAYLARGIYEFGKEMGWEDPGKFEKYSSSGTKAEKKKLIIKTLDAWKGKFSLKYQVADPSFDKTSFDLASRYLRSMGGILGSHRFKPKSGVVFFTMYLSSNAKKIAVTSNDNGKHIKITLPLEFEPTQWDDKVKAGLKRFDKDTL